MLGLLLIVTPASSADLPNVLLIVSEDNGPELGCYGDPYANTPNLDRLAREGVRFEHAFVPYSVCSPSRAAFLTGLYPHQNGEIGLATHKFAMYRKDTPNIVTLLKSAGYHTGLIGKLHVNPASAFPFDFYAHNLADQPQYAEVQSRLIDSLHDWQRQTRDPFQVQQKVDAYVQEQLANRDNRYRTQQDFRWSYLDDFRAWRDRVPDSR